MTDTPSKSNTVGELTPGMRQYMEAKRSLPKDTLLMFRMGDFYEMFFEDAKIAAGLMNVVLTSRAGAPLCGVPYKAVRLYVPKLLAAGYKVALADQMEDAKQAKGLVRRDITEVISPGTVMEDSLLDDRRSNYLAALLPASRGGLWGLASLELSTGEFRVAELNGEELEAEVTRLNPAEVLAPATLLEQWEKNGFPQQLPYRLQWTPLEDWHFDIPLATQELQRHFHVASLDGFGCRGMEVALGAAGAILHYACRNLRKDASNITSIVAYQPGECLILDRISQRNLELVDPLFTGEKNNTLLSVMDETVTPMGARLLRDWMLRPLRKRQEILRRQDSVGNLVEKPMLLGELRESLAAIRDLERTVTRLAVGSNATARDLVALRNALEMLPGLKTLLRDASAPLLQELGEAMEEMPQLAGEIRRAVVEEPPATIHDGGLFQAGYNQELDILRTASSEGKDWIAQYQLQEQQRTGIKSLKVRFNKVFGYFIEITKSFLDQVPQEYIRKQTIVNGERFITPELKEIEDKVLGADEKSRALEYELFQEMRQQVCQHLPAIQRSARAIAQVDCLESLAQIANQYQYVRPEILEDPVLEILDGRHPVLDARMTDTPFVPNDCHLDANDGQIALITGPNMAGKSTYIRQVALLVLMAQMGSFIPARAARIGLADRIFTRVGAADDLSRGQSTFMVEMVETANILNHATPKSLIILDEIGRGTSTFDGLSLAWAIAEYLHDTPAAKARTLFATHYHELTELAAVLPGVKNYTVQVRDQGETIVFLRRIVPGSADKSYGIHVARLAGMPTSVIARANDILSSLESQKTVRLEIPKRRRASSGEDPACQMQLF